MVVYGRRQKLFPNISCTTSYQAFVQRIQNWLKSEHPENFSIFFYDQIKCQIIILDETNEYYLKPVFDFVLSQNQSGVLELIATNDSTFVQLYISVNQSSTGPYQLQLNHLFPQNLSPTTSTEFGNFLMETNLDDLVLMADKNSSSTTNTQFILKDHILVKKDVCSTPKRVNYASNQGTKGKGRLSYLSGERRPHDSKKQIRPILRMPTIVIEWLKAQSVLHLLVAYVRETVENDKRIWHIDMHSEFRRKGSTSGENPIKLPVTLKDIQKKQYKLNVILTHIPGKISKERKGEEFHSLLETCVNQLHSAPHDPDSSRVAFMICCNDIREYRTFGLLNFIKKPTTKKRTESAAD